MELQPHWKLRWSITLALALPTLLLFGWSALHPAPNLKASQRFTGSSNPSRPEQVLSASKPHPAASN